MGKVDEIWSSVSIPLNLLVRMKNILRFVTDQSLAEYARHAIQKRLQVDEAAFEEQKMEEQEIKERLKD